jgi:hypothetical protein
MRQPVAPIRPASYQTALADVARDLGAALARLDALAAEPRALLLDPERAAQLASLQYKLHAASEAILALAPPVEAIDLHEDLERALVVAREATGAIAAALEHGEPLGSLIYEWRGALFRVRVARAELAQEPPGPTWRDRVAALPWTKIQALILLVVALVAVGAGAHASIWPLVAAGVAAVGLGISQLLRRP